MKRIAIAGLTLVLLWALVPALGEFVENAVHFAQQGHSAHASADGDRHEPLDSEHGCTGAVHLCHCCVSVSVLLTGLTAVAPAGDYVPFNARPSTDAVSPPAGSVYHPPRA